MTSMTRTLRVLAMLVAIGFAAEANAAYVYYSITGGGGQAQIGDGLPLPIQKNRTSPGMQPIGTGTKFPPLLISVNPNPGKALVQQSGTGPAKIKVGPAAFLRVAPSPKVVGVANNNPKVFQVKTRISFSGPAAKTKVGTVLASKLGGANGTMTFKANGWRTMTVTFMGQPATSVAQFTGSTNRFGGPSQTRVAAFSPVGVWVNAFGAMLPCKNKVFNGGVSTANGAACFALKVPAHPRSVAAAGGGQFTGGGKVTMGTSIKTPGAPVTSPGQVNISIPNTTGLIFQSNVKKATGTLTNKASSVGWPWTTGHIKLSQPKAVGVYELFNITGNDGRTAMGAGTISLVAGALSNRKVSGPNANRSWAKYTLPEPGPALGAGAALAVLGLCHAIVRRRSR